MPPEMHLVINPLLEAVAFAARAHQKQIRKDGQTPYVSHPLRVCLILSQVFAVRDLNALVAAVLHDTLEDTDTDYDDLQEKWGSEVASWVSALSKDKRLPEEEREAAYCQQLAAAPWQVQVCKLADMYDNLVDALQLPPNRRLHVLKRVQTYLNALGSDLKPEAAAAWEQVRQLHQQIQYRSP
jgi:(p)ppGpp synthase/HD superfamily hydrolase